MLMMIREKIRVRITRTFSWCWSNSVSVDNKVSRATEVMLGCGDDVMAGVDVDEQRWIDGEERWSSVDEWIGRWKKVMMLRGKERWGTEEGK